jgi:CDP-diacylglycerol--glycerol-3-phosphate 3-phosphatidyltransferase
MPRADSKEENIWTISNLLSIFRILLVIPIAVLLLSHVESNRYWAFGLGLVAVLTDKLDGELARRYHHVTEFGKIIDPLADKIAVVTIGAILTIQHLLPLWFVITIASRDILILLAGLYLKFKKNIVPQSNISGRITVCVISVVLIITILNIQQLNIVKEIFITVSVVMLIVSFYAYFQNFIDILTGKEIIS